MSRQDRQDSPEDLAPLLRAASSGDEAAWRTLVGLYGRRVFALAKSRCRDVNVAEEITQSVFATIAGKLGQGEYAERGRFESWLFRVAMNRVRDHARRLRRQAVVNDSDAVQSRPASPSDHADADALARLREAMDQLTEADREIVELRHHAGLSFREIGDMLNEPLGTLLARHHRALKKLRDLIEPRDASMKEALS